jgi:hypothetical protein
LTYPRPKKWFHSAALATQLGCPIIQLSLLIPIVYHPISILKQKANNDPSSHPWHKNIPKFQKALVKRNFCLMLVVFFFFFFFLGGEMEWCARGVENTHKTRKKPTNYKYIYYKLMQFHRSFLLPS